MRSKIGKCIILASALSACAGGMTGTAQAGYWERDHVYADSFGNLVIESAAGYKRIIVGEGRMAKQLSEYVQAGAPTTQPDVVYSEDGDRVFETEGCYRAPYFLRGRSYMYGFDEGEIPFQGGPCR